MLQIALRIVRSPVFALLWPTIKDFLTDVGAAALRSARELVEQANTQDGWSKEERAAWVREELKRIGADKGWRASLINRALEIALRALKAPDDELAEAEAVHAEAVALPAAIVAE